MGDGGSGCASSSTSEGNQAREPAKLLPLQDPRPIFSVSPSIPSALRASPTFSTPQDHPNAPSAAKATNTGQRGSSPAPPPVLPAYKKVLSISLTLVGSAVWLQMAGMTGFSLKTFGRGGREGPTQARAWLGVRSYLLLSPQPPLPGAAPSPAAAAPAPAGGASGAPPSPAGGTTPSRPGCARRPPAMPGKEGVRDSKAPRHAGAQATTGT